MKRRTTLPIAVVVMAAIAILLAACDQARSSPQASPSAPIATESRSASRSPSATPSATASPSEPTGPIEVAWERVEGLEPEASVLGVSFADDRWFALGQVFPEAAIWTSDDGRTWSRAEIASTRAEDEVTAVTGLVELDGMLVAIGSFGMMQTDQFAWMTWTSDDGGATWTESRDGASPHALRAIVAGGPGLIAAGWDYAGTTPVDAWIAVSSDGISWERNDAVFPDSEVHSFAALDDRIVAVGNLYTSSTRFPAAWYSDDDGATWTQADVPDGGREFETAYDVVSVEGGVLAIGGAIEGAVAWVSADGATWERVDIVDGAQAHALALVDGGMVAVGNVTGQNFGPQLSWTSLDGRTWESGHQFDDGSVQILAAGGAGRTVVSGGQCLGSCEAVLWVGEVASR